MPAVKTQWRGVQPGQSDHFESLQLHRLTDLPRLARHWSPPVSSPCSWKPGYRSVSNSFARQPAQDRTANCDFLRRNMDSKYRKLSVATTTVPITVSTKIR